MVSRLPRATPSNPGNETLTIAHRAGSCQKMKMTQHKPLNKWQRLWRGVTRLTLASVSVACVALFWASYRTIHPLAASRCGRVALWSAGAAMAPMFRSIPWYVYGVVAVVAAWLWIRHKIVGSLVAALIIGAWLAL